jgi:fibronectin-binding autotransporter adhesin
MNKKRRTTEGGYVMLIITVLFLGISLAILLGAATPIVSQYGRASGLLSSKQSYLVARSAAEDAFYRLKTNKSLPASVTLTLASGEATVLTSDSAGQKNITISGDTKDYERNMAMSISTGAGINFNYGLQAGNGGMRIDGGSAIIGNVYSNGTVHAVSATITGTAVAADSASLTADQANETPIPPTTSLNFRNAAATQDFAQSFQVTDSNLINKVQFYMKKTGNPSNATVMIAADNNGSPASTNLVSTNLNSGLVTANYGWIEAVFATNISLIPGETYWLIIQNGSKSTSAYYTIGANNAYANGTAKLGKYGGAWTTQAHDGYFRLYTGGIPSYIGGATYPGGVNIGTAGVGNAWASTVKGATVQGTIYCTTGTNNNKACDTSQGAAPPQPLPFSDANIQEWKDEAAAGNTLGATTIGYAGGTMGPTKINGNLTVNGGGTLTLNGPLWVTGNITISNGGKVVLPSGYGKNSETIVADGTITVSGGGSAGSGTDGSYLFMVSTSLCPHDVGCSTSAINITGGAGAVAATAQEGTVSLSGGAAISAVVGNAISVTGGSDVIYDQGLASPSFQSGPSGGYVLQSWIEN